MTPEPCEVVYENCAQGPYWGRTRARCFACGGPACPDCSVRMKYLRFGTQRIGFDCIENGMPFPADGNDRTKGRALVARVLALREARREARRREIRRRRKERT